MAHQHRFRVLSRVEQTRGQRATLLLGRVRGAFAAALLLLVLLAALWLVIDPLPRLLTNVAGLSAKNALAARNASRAALFQAVGGIAFLGGLVFTARSFRLTREGQITDRFSQAVGHLGSDQLTVRIGGLYALERIGRDSPGDRRAVRENLLRFVTVSVPSCDEDNPIFTVPSDAQAAISILGRRKGIEHESKRLNFGELCLRGFLGELSDWRNADFGHSILYEAEFMDCNCDGAIFHDADLRGASFSRSSLRDVYMPGADARGAFFVGADLRASDLEHANLQGAMLRGIDKASRWRRGRPTRMTDAKLADAILLGVDLHNVDLRGATGLTPQQLADAEVCEHTRLDPGLRLAYEQELRTRAAGHGTNAPAVGNADE